MLLADLRMRRNGCHFPPSQPSLVIGPRHRRGAVGEVDHGHAIVDRADQGAEIATDAVVFADLRYRLPGNAAGAAADPQFLGRLQVNALMSAILARDVAEVAADTFV